MNFCKRFVVEPGGLLCLVSLTYGSSGFQKAVSGVWSRIHAARPALVGGCRPVELLDFVSSPDWRVEFRDVVCGELLIS
jgi:hypothetical protein